MLTRYRILDLTDARGLLAGQVLADLGANVIQLEPPEGSPARRLGRSVIDNGGNGGSSWWAGYARNKRGVKLDLTSAKDRTKFLELLTHSDVVLESFDPGYLSSLALGYEDLAGRNEQIILTSITSFGQTGPKAAWPATDLTVNAASGAQYTIGDEDRAPLSFTVPQPFLHASMDAVLGTLVALQERKQSGRGQHIDVSAQQSASLIAIANVLAASWGHRDGGAITRVGGGAKFGPLPLRFTYPAKDGLITTTFVFGNTIGPAVGRLFQWMHDEGFCDAATRDLDWVGLGGQLIDGSVPLSELFRLQQLLADFTATKSKTELFQAAKERHLLLAPVSTTKDLLVDPNLKARSYWSPSGSPDDSLVYPGPFAKFSASPIVYKRRAPRLGEHNAEVFEELAGSTHSSKTRNFASSYAQHAGPLAGLKIVDFGTTVVVPLGVRFLRDFGATVVKIDGTRRLDTARTLVPLLNGEPGLNRSAIFGVCNAGKLGLALDLKKPAGRDVAMRLAKWADVVTEGFSPGVMARLGLDYPAMKAVNPGLIYLSASIGGRVGEYTKVAGYGNIAAALAGFNSVCGWRDRPSVAPGAAYTDYIAPRFVATAILAALEHREQTGEGQHIDLAQMEAAIHFLTPAVLEYVVNGDIVEPNGNRAPNMAPHGVFPCQGTDRWVAIAVRSDRDWRQLCSVEGLEGLNAAELRSLEGRKKHEAEIEERLSEWTAMRSAESVQALLIAVGVPAHVVADASDLPEDPQLRHRKHFVEVPSSEHGTVVLESPRFTLSRTAHSVNAFSPSIGEHAYEVLGGLLGYSETEIAEMAALEVLE